MRVLLILASYLFGSITPARFVGKIKNVDLTNQGTRNPGATNVYRVVGPKWGVAVGLLDLFKGIIPPLTARLVFDSNPYVLAMVGLGVVAGHNWPVYYGFAGGRGLATSLGTLASFHFWLIFFSFALTLLVVLMLMKYFKIVIRIPFVLYPLFILMNRIFLQDEFLLHYALLLMVMAFFRAWQVHRKRSTE
ncbi:MAG: glycerol-3-phosphate acyltransferase [Halanaerobiales bacterium]